MPPEPQSAVLPVATVADVLRAPDATVVDLRSPEEFADDHVPGAHSVPLFDDAERALVGTLYRRTSASDAFERGREIVAAKVRELVERIAAVAGWTPAESDLAADVRARTEGGLARFEAAHAAARPQPLPERPVVLHCWRGGLRSRSVVALLRALGLERAVLLEGGYKAYRRRVLDELAVWSAPPTFVLRGLTGVGKTLVLRELERIRPGWTLDLEACAGHRSSILGMVGLEPCSQKTFDTRVAARLRAGLSGPLVVEGESRKVGDVIVPASVWAALTGGRSFELVAPLERRVQVLVEDYLERPENRAELRRRLPFLEQRIGARKFAGALVELLDAGREEELVEVLLERYYDPLYAHSEADYAYAARIETSDPRAAAESIAGWIESGRSCAERCG